MDPRGLLLLLGWGIALLMGIAVICFCVFVCRRKSSSAAHKQQQQQQCSSSKEIELVHSDYIHLQTPHEEEKQLLLQRLQKGGFECPRALRLCIRELQIHLAAAEATHNALKQALQHKQNIFTNPPTLLIEAWLVHGELYPERDAEQYPNLGIHPKP